MHRDYSNNALLFRVENLLQMAFTRIQAQLIDIQTKTLWLIEQKRADGGMAWDTGRWLRDRDGEVRTGQTSEPEPENLRSAAATFWVTFTKQTKTEPNSFTILGTIILNPLSYFCKNKAPQ